MDAFTIASGGELGMLRHLTDAKRLAALRLVREGRVYDLGRILDEHVPVFPGRSFHQTLVTTAHHAATGDPKSCPTIAATDR